MSAGKVKGARKAPRAEASAEANPVNALLHRVRALLHRVKVLEDRLEAGNAQETDARRYVPAKAPAVLDQWTVATNDGANTYTVRDEAGRVLTVVTMQELLAADHGAVETFFFGSDWYLMEPDTRNADARGRNLVEREAKYLAYMRMPSPPNVVRFYPRGAA